MNIAGAVAQHFRIPGAKGIRTYELREGIEEVFDQQVQSKMAGVIYEVYKTTNLVMRVEFASKVLYKCVFIGEHEH